MTHYQQQRRGRDLKPIGPYVRRVVDLNESSVAAS
jgi:hypothetical protein